MCLAVPGRILSIAIRPPAEIPSAVSEATPGNGESPGDDPLDPLDDLWRVAEVDFGGVRQQVSLACLREARVGDRVLVHVGVALSIVDEDLP